MRPIALLRRTSMPAQADGEVPTPPAAGDRTATVGVQRPSAVSAATLAPVMPAAAAGDRGLPVLAAGAVAAAVEVGAAAEDSEVAAAVVSSRVERNQEAQCTTVLGGSKC